MRQFFTTTSLFLLLFNTWGQDCLNVKDFGATGDGTTNDFTALQQAVDSAAITGNTVCIPAGVYNFSPTLHVPAGVNMSGAGIGSELLGTPHNGSILRYTGTDTALSITGSGVILSKFTVLDQNNAGATHGIMVLASNKLVESVVMENILLSGFADGTALSLAAINSGGIAYCSFYDVRIRHAHQGIYLYQDAGSFVNSNAFFHGAISGGGFDKALHINGGNNNLFYSTVIEPPSSTSGHIYVAKGQITGYQIRVEGISQSPSIPLIYFDSDADESYLSGHFSGGLVENTGNNTIAFSSSKYVGETNSNSNQLVNASFYSDATQGVPRFWSLTGTGVVVSGDAAALIKGCKVLEVKVPPGITATLAPDNKTTPQLYDHPEYDYANFNVYVKTDESNMVATLMTGALGLGTSSFHSGNNDWQLLGLRVPTGASNPLPKIWLDNSSGSDTAVAYLTSPAFTFGQSFPDRTSNPISGSGGVMTGSLTSGYTSHYSFISGTNYLVLAHEGNYFDITGTVTINRINHQTADQFLKGTVVTLLFDQTGCNVVNSAYIKLKSGFTTATANSSLTLISNGDGTWREVSRNN